MAEILPKWLMRRYLVLRDVFGTKKFSFKQAEEALGDDARVINLFLSDIKKHGWLDSEQDPKDSRKKLYYLKDMNSVYEGITKEVMKSGKI